MVSHGQRLLIPHLFWATDPCVIVSQINVQEELLKCLSLLTPPPVRHEGGAEEMQRNFSSEGVHPKLDRLCHV